MGKASRAKRERRETGGGADRSGPVPITPPAQARSFPVFWAAVALLVVAGLAALVVSAPDESERARDAEASQVPSYSDVTVDGAALPTWDGGKSADPAEGRSVPTIRATDFDGMRRVLDVDGRTARAYVVLAHWCPHCQAEVPRIVDWAKDHELPAGVEVVAISTSVDDGQPNFPPATWLAREEWPFRSLIDDEVGSAAEALGVEGFPFLVFADRHGRVVSRYSGEMPIDEFDDAIAAIAPKGLDAGAAPAKD